MLKVVFMGTPEFAVPALELINQAHQVIAVYTQPDKSGGRGLNVKASPVKTKSQQLGLPIFQPEKLSQPGEYERLSSLAPDVIVIVAYGQILKKNVLELPRLGCVNIHSSLLPRWRGAAPIHWALLAGDLETGVSTMKLVEKLDAGDVYLESRTPISPLDTVSDLHDRLAKLGADLILPTLQGLSAGTLKGKPQDETKVTYAVKLTKEMEALSFSESAQILDRKVRALNPWPGTSVWISGQRLKIKEVKLRENLEGHPGELYERSGMLLLGCSPGALEIVRAQWEGKKEIDAGALLNGLRGKGLSLPIKLHD